MKISIDNSFWAGVIVTILFSVTGMATGVAVYRSNQVPYNAVTVETVKLIAEKTSKHCEKIKSRNFKLQADGLTIVGGCVK